MSEPTACVLIIGNEILSGKTQAVGSLIPESLLCCSSPPE